MALGVGSRRPATESAPADVCSCFARFITVGARRRCFAPAPPVTSLRRSDAAPSFAEPSVAAGLIEIAVRPPAVTCGACRPRAARRGCSPPPAVPARPGPFRVRTTNQRRRHAAAPARSFVLARRKRLAFVSTQPGANGIYVLTLDARRAAARHARRSWCDVSAWSAPPPPDGRFVYFASASQNIAATSRRVPRRDADGGTPMRGAARRLPGLSSG